MKGNSSALRIGRFSECGRIYLITFTTYKRQSFFADFRLGRLVVESLMSEEGADTLAYVVMPDHVHWLLQLKSRSLSRSVQAVKSLSARGIKKYGVAGGYIWQKGFHDRALRSEDDLRGVARYVIMNPVRAGLVRSVSEYSLWDAAWL